MAHTYEELSTMTVAHLREIAQGIDHEAVKGFSTMHKEKLLPAICMALGIDAHAHHHVVGLDKTAIKTQIRTLKQQRTVALAAKNHSEYRRILHEIHALKNRLRRATV
jgi:UDP-N-acetylmuramyl tripeptide synthase